MSPDEEAKLDLMRELRASAHLQQAWVTQLWQAERGLHPAAATLLSDLAKYGEARPSELAKRRMVDLSVISRQVAQLAATGMIDRRPAPEDGRASLIRISERGEQELARWRVHYLDFMSRALGDWDAARTGRLTTLLAAMNDDLRGALKTCHPLSQAIQG